MKKLLTILLLLHLPILMQAQDGLDIIWNKFFGSSGTDTFSAVQQTSDSGFIVVGQHSGISDQDVSEYTKGGEDIWILKINSEGVIEWERSFGGSLDDGIWDVKETSDKGFILAGYSDSYDGDIVENKGDRDVLIVKLNEFGLLEWVSIFGGSHTEEAKSVQQTKDGGYIVAGLSSSTDGDIKNPKGQYDYWLIKLDENGLLEWSKSYGGSDNDIANSVIQSDDGNYYISGLTYSADGDVTDSKGSIDIWLLKLDNSGAIIWEKSYGGSGVDIANSMKQTNDGGIIIAGYSNSTDGSITENFGKDDYWIIKLNSHGEFEWQKSLGGSDYDNANSVIQTADGSYLVLGTSLSNDGDITSSKGKHDYWLAKLSNTGELVWEKSFGGSNDDFGISIIETFSEEYLVAGYSESDDTGAMNKKGGRDFWLVKFQDNITDVEELKNPSNVNYTISPNITDKNDRININSIDIINTVQLIDINGNTYFRKNEINGFEYSFKLPDISSGGMNPLIGTLS